MTNNSNLSQAQFSALVDILVASNDVYGLAEQLVEAMGDRKARAMLQEYEEMCADPALTPAG